MWPVIDVFMGGLKGSEICHGGSFVNVTHYN